MKHNMKPSKWLDLDPPGKACIIELKKKKKEPGIIKYKKTHPRTLGSHFNTPIKTQGK